MKTLLTTLACAVALCTGTVAQAAVVTFNNPGVINIAPDGTATYTEAGFTISGEAASFLTLNDALIGGLDSSFFSLRTVGAGRFGLQSLDYAFFDLGFGLPPRQPVGDRPVERRPGCIPGLQPGRRRNGQFRHRLGQPDGGSFRGNDGLCAGQHHGQPGARARQPGAGMPGPGPGLSWLEQVGAASACVGSHLNLS